MWILVDWFHKKQAGLALQCFSQKGVYNFEESQKPSTQLFTKCRKNDTESEGNCYTNVC